MSPDKTSFSIKSINNKQIICHGGIEFVFKIPQKDQTLLYRCVHASCSATLKLSRDKTSIVGGTFTHARHSPVGPSVKPAFRSSASERSSANTTPLSSSKSAKSSPLPRTPSGHNSTSSSFDFEFSTPLVKPPRNGTSLSTRASTYSFDSPPPSLPKSNSHDGLGSSSSHDTIVLKDDSFFPDVPENAQLLQRIDELVIQRDALIGKIQELSSKLEVNSSTTQVPKTDFSVNRIAIFSDSMCRGVSKIIHDKFCSSAKVSSLVKPNANFFQVTKNIPSFCKDFGTKDVIVIQAGTNDMSLLQPNSAKILPVKHFVHLASKTNIILCSVPYRYDNLAHLTTNIFETNSYVKYVCRKHNFTYFDTNAFMHRSLYTRHGLHYNMKGKRIMSNRLVKFISTLPIRDNKQSHVSSNSGNSALSSQISMSTFSSQPEMSYNCNVPICSSLCTNVPSTSSHVNVHNNSNNIPSTDSSHSNVLVEKPRTEVSLALSEAATCTYISTSLLHIPSNVSSTSTPLLPFPSNGQKNSTRPGNQSPT